MTIELYINVSEPHRLNKNLVSGKTYTGTLKNRSSVIDPTFTIESSDNLSQYNYCYIPAFNRYYFISNIEVINVNLWGFGCHVDVLTTYKSHLKSLSAIISRQELEYNLYLTDDKLLVEVDRDIITLGFNNPLASASGGRSFVLTIAGGSTQTS